MDKKEKRVTTQQQKFVREYMKEPNIYQAAINAGYSESYARHKAHELLGKVGIQRYMKEIQDKVESPDIASAKEVLTFLTSTMRGEINDQFGLDPSLSDRLDAAKQLQKRYGLDKVALVGGKEEDGDNPLKVESVQIILPDNGRGKNE